MSELKYSRKDYMANKCSHKEYYSQFGEHLVGLVITEIGTERILASTDSHFNDIPLKEWDALCPAARGWVGGLFKKANMGLSPSNAELVCAAKAAATIIKTTHA